MNIQEAKEEIKAALEVYHRKDEWGVPVYPALRQRPILLMGPPGIGKTAVMRQIAQECGVGLVAYTMTHHTRQSAVGLPRIVEREYAGEHYFSTQYTLSEIIASVYECMERTGCREGILFIDEINCVSETLAPVMLEFLQNKRFGNHEVPEGWMIVAAGNPPEYNKSAREFDIVTLDRVRLIEVEADVSCWLNYAAGAGVHGAVSSYLSLHPERFFRIRQEGPGKRFVTARGWEDLSRLILSYEETGREVTDSLVAEFLQDPSEAAYFAGYYRIYQKYGQDYGVREYLTRPEERKTRTEKMAGLLRNASLEERLTVTMQLAGVLGNAFHAYAAEERVHGCYVELTGKLPRFLSAAAAQTAATDVSPETSEAGTANTKQEGITPLERLIRTEEQLLERKQADAGNSPEKEQALRKTLVLLRNADREMRAERVTGRDRIREALAQQASEQEARLSQRRVQLQEMVFAAFALLENAPGPEKPQELFLLVSALARNPDAARFLTDYPNEKYNRAAGII